MDASFHSPHNSDIRTSPQDLGLGADTLGANDLTVFGGLSRDPQHVSAADRYGTGGLFARSHQFLENVKRHFGEHSKQSIIIHDTLGEFRVGRLPKQEVQGIIVGQLSDRLDLVEDYMSIANPHNTFMGSPGVHHQQASAPSTPVSLVSPGFLQPQHQPRLTMPLWSPIRFNQRTHHMHQASINPELLRGPRTSTSMLPRQVLPFQQVIQPGMNNNYENHSAYHPAYTHSAYNSNYCGSNSPIVPTSPAIRAPVRFGGHNHYTCPAIGHMQQPSVSPLTEFNHGAQFSSPQRDMDAQLQHSYPLHEGWQRNFRENQHEPEVSVGQHFDSSPLANEGPSRSFHLGNPIAVPLGQSAFDVSSPKKGYRKLSQAFAKREEEPGHNEDVESRRSYSVNTVTMQPSQSSQHSSARRRSIRAPRAKGHFVHSICGTPFTTRYAVKKHHWGSKCDNLQTTTGCWAKNNKPDVQWDDHPSCREQQASNAPSVMSPCQSTSKTTLPETRIPVVPTIAPKSQNTASGPGLPIFNEMPQKAVESAQGLSSSPPFRQVCMLPYHASRPPVRGGIDTLLMAVNVAMKIDAPTPQSRNDSIVSNLDAQVAAAEEHQIKTTPRSAAPYDQSDSPFKFSTHHIPPLNESLLPPLSEVELGATKAYRSHSIALDGEGTNNQQAKRLVASDTDHKTMVDVEDAHPMVISQTTADVSIAAEQKGPCKRVRGPHDTISKRELKMLLECSPPRTKRQRTA